MLEEWIIEGAARTEDAKRPRIDGETEIEQGEGVWGGGSVSPFPEKFW